MSRSTRVRCSWAEADPLLQAYHDEEWGVPLRESRALWGKLALDGFQAGLSWLTILKKRDAFREAFDDFDPERVARYTPRRVERLLQNPGIIRSRAKIEATIHNARAYLKMRDAGEDFGTFAWSFTEGETIVTPGREWPAKTPLSEMISKELRRRGYKFAGPVIVYAWMQAVGIVDDHAADCFRRRRRSPGRRGQA